MAKKRKQTAMPSGGATATPDDYRAELVRLVRRQLECAKRGEIGTKGWRLAWGGDIDRIEDCAYWSHLRSHPVPMLVTSIDGTVEEWTVLDDTPAPAEEPAFGLRRHVYRLDARDPDALEAMNKLAARVIEEWLGQFGDAGQTPPNDDDFKPWHYFKPLGIPESTLRRWKKAGELKWRKRGAKVNLYCVDEVFDLFGVADKAKGRKKCDDEWTWRNETGRR